MKHLYFLILSLSFILVLSSCAGTKDKKVDASSAEMIPEDYESTKVDLDPKYHLDAAHDFFLRGLYFKNSGNNDAAIMFYNKAYEYDSSSTLALELSNMYLETNQYKKALSVIKNAVINNKDTAAHYFLHIGRVSNLLQELDSAYKYYDLGINESNSTGQVLFEYSMVLQALGKYKELTEVYDRLLIDLDYPPELIQKQLLLGLMLSDDSIVLKTLKSAWENKRTKVYGDNYLDALRENNKNEDIIPLLNELIIAFPESLNEYKMLKSHTFSSMGEMDSMISVLRDLVEDNPDSLSYLRMLAVGEMAVENYPEAIKQLKLAINKDPENSTTYRMYDLLGQIYGEQNELDSAISYANKALEIRQKNKQYVNLAYLYAKDSKPILAHAYLDTAIQKVDEESKETNISASYNLSKLYHAKATLYIIEANNIFYKFPPLKGPERNLIKQKRTEADVWFKKSLDLDSTNLDVKYAMASNLERLGQVDAAISLFDKIIKEDPNYASALNYYGYVLVESNTNLEYGIALIDSALALNPNNDAYIDSKAWGLYQSGKYLDAWEAIKKLEDDDFDLTIMMHKAAILEKLGKEAEANVIWRKVLMIDNYNKEALKRLPKK